MTYQEFLLKELIRSVTGSNREFWLAKFNRNESLSNNKSKRCLSGASTTKARRIATPIWLNYKKNKQDIKDLHSWVKDFSLLHNKKYTVDHVVPLRNSLVCGLHVPNNLRIVVYSVNKAKGNSFTIK